jgi:hypothetical protein
MPLTAVTSTTTLPALLRPVLPILCIIRTGLCVRAECEPPCMHEQRAATSKVSICPLYDGVCSRTYAKC